MSIALLWSLISVGNRHVILLSVRYVLLQSGGFTSCPGVTERIWSCGGSVTSATTPEPSGGQYASSGSMFVMTASTVRSAPASAGSGIPWTSMLRSATRVWTVIGSVAVLLSGFGSGTAELTVAE